MLQDAIVKNRARSAGTHSEIDILNAGKDPERLKAWGDPEKPKRPVRFSTLKDAAEAVLIIDTLRCDSAYEGSLIVGPLQD